MGKKKNIKSKNDIKEDKGSRKLVLPLSINLEFNKIKKFSCYSKLYARKFFHGFYSLAIAYAARELEPNELRDYILNGKGINKNPKNEEIKNAIDAPQLSHHDFLFKIIAYWYALKMGDEKCYKYIIETNKARELCEELFFRYYEKFINKLKNLSTEIPNIDLLNDILD
ncbi:MAG: hypothetical protein ACP6IY_19390 [Promethearchaeia archaeon]